MIFTVSISICINFKVFFLINIAYIHQKYMVIILCRLLVIQFSYITLAASLVNI